MALPSMIVRRTLNRALLLRSSPQLLRSNTNPPLSLLKKQISCFHTSVPRASSRHSLNQNQEDEAIGPDTILFEGCDYNHWLITMDFPKDPKPTPQQMVDTYVNTLAQVVGSVEEAKRRMYACSTTTYTGFQAVMTEEMSEKFKGLPGVVFILPDSYIDPVNKEYGGDKYDNGVITHRPPPYQYNQRYAGGGDRRPRNPQPPMQNDRQPPPRPQHYNQGPPPQHAAPNFNPRPDGRNHLPQQHNYSNPQNFPPNPPFQQNARTYDQPQHNYAPTLSDQRGPPPTGNNNYPPNTYPTQTNPIPPYQRGSSQVGGRDYNQPDNRDFRGEHRNIGSSYDANYRQGPGTGFSQMEHRDNMQGQQNFPPTRNDQQGGY